jgi:hypothetical protein
MTGFSPGPKGRDLSRGADAALKEPLFHGGTHGADYHLGPPFAKIGRKGEATCSHMKGAAHADSGLSSEHGAGSLVEERPFMAA